MPTTICTHHSKLERSMFGENLLPGADVDRSEHAAFLVRLAASIDAVSDRVINGKGPTPFDDGLETELRKIRGVKLSSLVRAMERVVPFDLPLRRFEPPQ